MDTKKHKIQHKFVKRFFIYNNLSIYSFLMVFGETVNKLFTFPP